MRTLSQSGAIPSVQSGAITNVQSGEITNVPCEHVTHNILNKFDGNYFFLRFILVHVLDCNTCFKNRLLSQEAKELMTVCVCVVKP